MFTPVVFSVLSFLAATTHATNVWTVSCAPLSIQMSDPIVSPGEVASHVHAISGGTGFHRTMGSDTSVDSTATTCDKFTDHSNYWCPQLYHQDNDQFTIVPYMGVEIYYENFTCSYKEDGNYCDNPTDARAFPEGLRMVAGSSTRRTLDMSDQTNQAILFETGNNGELYALPSGLEDRLSFHVRFPSCWDGVNVDSADHKSHMAYPDPARGSTKGGICPQSHPVALISLGAEFGFDTGSLGLKTSQGLVLANGDTTGYGFHGDFLQGWQDLIALEKSFSNCTGRGAACAWNSFGTPDGQPGQKSTQVLDVLPEWEEEMGLNWPIRSLPGNNPVYSPGVSSSQPAETQISVPAAEPTTLGSTPTTMPAESQVVVNAAESVTLSAIPTTLPTDAQEYVPAAEPVTMSDIPTTLLAETQGSIPTTEPVDVDSVPTTLLKVVTVTSMVFECTHT